METCTAHKKEVKKHTCMDPLPMAAGADPSHSLYALKEWSSLSSLAGTLSMVLQKRVSLKEGKEQILAPVHKFPSLFQGGFPVRAFESPPKSRRSDLAVNCQWAAAPSWVSAVGAISFYPKSTFHGKHPWVLSLANVRRRVPKFPELLYCVCANLAELNASLEILQSLPGYSWENGRFREDLHVSAF